MTSQKGIAAIFSINLHTYTLNYGSALQSYALQTYLKSQGKESVIVDFIPTHALAWNKRPYYKKTWSFKLFVKMLRWRISFNRRNRKFQRFFKKHYLKTSNTYTNQQVINADSLEGLSIDTLICGSDTIWKADQTGGFNHAFFLDSKLSLKANKVAYAVSMGARDFSVAEETEFKELTSDYVAIGVREHIVANRIKKYLKIDPIHVCDPTLLLNSEEYIKLSTPPSRIKKGYVFIYTCEEPDIKMVEEARKLAKLKNLKVIEVSHFFNNKYIFNHKVINDCGIEEWLGYMYNADYVVTNSFHGCCFSIIFKKQVFLFERNKTDFKMPDLVNKLGMKQCLIKCENKTIPTDVKPVDYDEVYKRLDEFRRVSYNFIRDNIL